jgi:hypothetical protein
MRVLPCLVLCHLVLPTLSLIATNAVSERFNLAVAEEAKVVAVVAANMVGAEFETAVADDRGKLCRY